MNARMAVPNVSGGCPIRGGCPNGCPSDRWLADTTLFGSAAEVREGIEEYFDIGIKTPIIDPSSANGGQFVAFGEFFAIRD